MNSTVAALVPYAKNGVILTLDVKKGNYYLYKLLLSNYELIENTLKKAGISLLDDSTYFQDEKELKLWILYNYGKTEPIKKLDQKTYNAVYYRASKKGISVDEYLKQSGFKIKEEVDLISLIENHNISIRQASSMIGMPKSTVHRLYKKQKGMV